MKNLYFGAAILFLGLSSCSSSDDNGSDSPTSTFFPLTSTSSWEYDVKLDSEDIGRDVLFVSGETTINGKIYQQVKTSEIPSGFYTSTLNNNNLRKDGDKLLLTGSTGLSTGDFLPFQINITDFVIFKENASSNDQLDIVSGAVDQELEGLPLKIDYKLKSVFKESLASFTVPGKASYSNVKVIKIIANLKVSTVYLVPVINTPLTVALLDSQDVIVSTHYYAEGIGMVYSKTDVNFQLNDFSQFGIELPIPQSGSSIIEEFLD